MDKYNYEAHDASGRIVKGMVEADSAESAEEILKYNKLFAVSVKPYISFEQRIINYFNSLFGGIRDKDRVIFARQLAIMINAGLPLTESLKELLKETTKKSMINVIVQIIAYIERGKTFSFALAQFPETFSPIFISMVRSGEMSGKLDEVLNNLASQLERTFSIKSKVRGALFYPAFIIMVMIGFSIYAITNIIPQLEELFNSLGSSLPILTRFLIILSHAVTGYWYIFIIGILAIFYLIRFLLNTDGGKIIYAKTITYIPVVNTINEGVYINDFAKNLGLLMKGGVPIVNSLIMISDSYANVLLREDLRRVVDDVERGITLSQSLSKSKNFPPLVVSMIAVGEKTGQLVAVLENISRMYEEDTDNTLKGFTSLVEPALMLLVGLGVAFLAIAVILPIFQLSNAAL